LKISKKHESGKNTFHAGKIKIYTSAQLCFATFFMLQFCSNLCHANDIGDRKRFFWKQNWFIHATCVKIHFPQETTDDKKKLFIVNFILLFPLLEYHDYSLQDGRPSRGSFYDQVIWKKSKSQYLYLGCDLQWFDSFY